MLKEYKMTIQELAPFLQSVSADILTLAFLTFIITNVIKKFIPDKLENKVGLIPFVLGIIFAGIYSLIVYKSFDLFSVFKKGVAVGGVATFIYAFIKQLLKKDNLEKNITNILYGIIDSGSLKTAVKQIIKNYSSDNTDLDNSDIISSVIQESTNFSKEECNTISDIIINALNNK